MSKYFDMKSNQLITLTFFTSDDSVQSPVLYISGKRISICADVTPLELIFGVKVWTEVQCSLNAQENTCFNNQTLRKIFHSANCNQTTIKNQAAWITFLILIIKKKQKTIRSLCSSELINTDKANASLLSPWLVINQEVRDVVPHVAVMVEVVHWGLQGWLQGVWVIFKQPQDNSPHKHREQWKRVVFRLRNKSFLYR